MAKPSVLPTWATSGGALKTEPSSGMKSSGWGVGLTNKPTAQAINWLFNIVCLWLAYIDTTLDSLLASVTSLTSTVSGHTTTLALLTNRRAAARAKLLLQDNGTITILDGGDNISAVLDNSNSQLRLTVPATVSSNGNAIWMIHAHKAGGTRYLAWNVGQNAGVGGGGNGSQIWIEFTTLSGTLQTNLTSWTDGSYLEVVCFKGVAE